MESDQPELSDFIAKSDGTSLNGHLNDVVYAINVILDMMPVHVLDRLQKTYGEHYRMILKACGKMHDIGKIRANFQDKLRQGRYKKSLSHHAADGAKAVYQVISPYNSLLAEIMAQTISQHHGPSGVNLLGYVDSDIVEMCSETLREFSTQIFEESSYTLTDNDLGLNLGIGVLVLADWYASANMLKSIQIAPTRTFEFDFEAPPLTARELMMAFQSRHVVFPLKGLKPYDQRAFHGSATYVHILLHAQTHQVLG